MRAKKRKDRRREKFLEKKAIPIEEEIRLAKARDETRTTGLFPNPFELHIKKHLWRDRGLPDPAPPRKSRKNRKSSAPKKYKFHSIPKGARSIHDDLRDEARAAQAAQDAVDYALPEGCTSFAQEGELPPELR